MHEHLGTRSGLRTITDDEIGDDELGRCGTFDEVDLRLVGHEYLLAAGAISNSDLYWMGRCYGLEMRSTTKIRVSPGAIPDPGGGASP